MSLRLRTRKLILATAVASAFGTVVSVPASANGSVPIRQLTPTAPLTITTTSLPPATVGDRYSATLQATGGTAPYLWSSSRLPSGLVLSSSGVLSGTARDVVTTSVVFYLTDSLKNGAVSPIVSFATLAPLSPSGQVYGWGGNSNAELGTGDGADRLVPVPIQGLSSVAAVASGRLAGYALKADGTMCDWGTNDKGELGDGTFQVALTPKVVPGVAGVRHISACTASALISLSDHNLWGWGFTEDSKVGLAASYVQWPTQVPGASSVVGVALGQGAGYELSSNGTVWAQGLNNFGALGVDPDQALGILHPHQVPGLTGVTALAAGNSTAYALRTDGTVWAWGANFSGQLGNGSNDEYVATPAQVAGLPQITAISAGSSTAYALAADGTVWAWGDNTSGALGHGSLYPAPAYSPVQVTGLSSVTKIAGGYDNGYALRSDGTVWAWGGSAHGELGTGSTAATAKPVQVKGLTGIVGIASGPDSDSAFAIKGS